MILHTITRERNREHAKRSRRRNKVRFDTLQRTVTLLKQENEMLRDAIKAHLGEDESKMVLSIVDSRGSMPSNPAA